MQAAERERLTRTMSSVSANPVGVVVKCGVCLGFLALLAVVGSGANDNDAIAPGAPYAGRETVSADDGVRADAHRKRVFDERRARLEGRASEVHATDPTRDSRIAIVAP